MAKNVTYLQPTDPDQEARDIYRDRYYSTLPSNRMEEFGTTSPVGPSDYNPRAAEQVSLREVPSNIRSLLGGMTQGGYARAYAYPSLSPTTGSTSTSSSAASAASAADPYSGSVFEAKKRLEILTDEAETVGGFNNLDEAKKKRFRELSSFIENKQEESAQNTWMNTLQASIIPSLFTNPFDKIQADREYGFALEQERRADERIQREISAEEQEMLTNQRSRENAFNVMATLNKTFPNLGIDTSAFEGELDPSLLGPLVQIALAKATQRNQRMAQPIYRMPA